MSDEGKKIGRCGWLALAIVLFLLPGLLAGSFYGGFAGLRAAEPFLYGEAAHLATQVMVLSGMIIGLLLSTMIVMALTIAIIRMSVSLLRNPTTSCSHRTVSRNQTQ
jgi:hypothetical protein